MKSEVRSPKSEHSLTTKRREEVNGADWALSDLTEMELAFWDVTDCVFAQSVADSSDENVLREDPPISAKIYDLSERTAQFGERVIKFAKTLPFNPVNNRPISQFVGAGTSIGANYCEADDSISENDLRHRISICRKEAKETRFWLRMLATAEPGRKDGARVLWREASELSLIFGSIWRKLNSRPNKGKPHQVSP